MHPYTFTQVYFHCDQLMRGMHAVYLERWLRYFPRETMLIVKAEDLFRCEIPPTPEGWPASIAGSSFRVNWKDGCLQVSKLCEF